VLAGDRGDNWTVADDLVLVAGRVYIPPASPLLQVVLARAHDMGHVGIKKTRPFSLGQRFMSYDCWKLDQFAESEFWVDSTFQPKSGF
jgi:hypothetical protein